MRLHRSCASNLIRNFSHFRFKESSNSSPFLIQIFTVIWSYGLRHPRRKPRFYGEAWRCVSKHSRTITSRCNGNDNTVLTTPGAVTGEKRCSWHVALREQLQPPPPDRNCRLKCWLPGSFLKSFFARECPELGAFAIFLRCHRTHICDVLISHGSLE